MTSQTTLEERVAALFTDSGQTLSTAESCTGGLIAHRLTNVSGASTFFMGGVVAYDNAVKASVLGVSEETLSAHGAVSAETASAMAEGVRRALRTDYGIAVTGIAGPLGGSPEKPVGLVFLAVSSSEGTRVVRRQFSGTRLEIKNQTADAALGLLLDRGETP